MTSQILATKLFTPSPSPNQVSRSRLLNRLQSGTARKLTLISAPAGFGKTSLLSEWISRCGYPVGWLSLDERDNDTTRFLRYFIFTLKQIDNDLGESTLMALQSSQPLEIDVLLTVLINEIAAVSQSFVTVLDDYHVITEPKIQELLLFLFEHQPRQMHLIISSRADPPWPLSRLRVRGEVLEIRSQEMRFTLQEAATFLNDAMGLELSPENIAALEKRTEGWIAGLQMAAISMKGHEDIAGFIQSFTGSHRFVMDYLVEEVLSQQSPEIREFLLKTSILERLTGPLCDEVVGRNNSQSILLDLEQRNLFLISLDDQRRWYRYHHLFRDLLQNHAQQTQDNILPDLHEKASLWYAKNGLVPDAIYHALTTNDTKRIAQLAEGLAVYKMDYGELNAFLSWLDRLPSEIESQYPWLLVARSWALFNTGKYETVEINLDQIEMVLSTQDISQELAERVRGHVAAIRSYLAEVREDAALGIQKAEDALALLPERDLKLRSFVAIRWANCLVGVGQLNKAIQAYREAGEASKRIGDGHLAITALSEMAVVQMWSGRLRQAIESITEISAYADMLTQKDGRQLPAMGILYRHVSHIKRELNDLPEAEHYARLAVKICRQWGEKEALVYGLAALTRAQFAQRQFRKVDQNLREMLEIAGQISPLTMKYFQNWKIHYQLMRGKIKEAEIWAHNLGMTSEDEFSYILYDRRFDHQNFARLLIAKREYVQAKKIVDALIEVAANVGDQLGTIQYRVLQANILNKMNRPNEALTVLGEALSFASAEGYIRAILDEGEAVSGLLRLAIAKGIEAAFAAKLLSMFDIEPKPQTAQIAQNAAIPEPLSDREMEVLRLLMTDLPTPEIAAELFISVSTVRTHIKNVYSKLDVHSRYEAVSKAKDLNLL